MIIHIWMHWFWITAASVEGFLFFAVQMISLSCIPYPFVAEAGLLDNETFIHSSTNLYEKTNSSQVDSNPNITSLPTDEITQPLEASSHRPLPLSSPLPSTEAEDAKSEDLSRMSTSDVEDTYNGGSIDVFQYPLKKFTKYSHIKYGKVKMKGKLNDEPVNEDKKAESVKIVEEKFNINISMGGDNESVIEPEDDKLNRNFAEGNASEISNDYLITTTLAIDDSISDVNETLSKEVVVKDEVSKPENSTFGSSTTVSHFSEVTLTSSTEDQKNVILKNETLIIENKLAESGIYTTVEPFFVKNRVAAATSAQNFDVTQSELNAGSITGIILGILVIFSLFGAVSFVLYRRRYLNKPQVLHDKCSNLDSSGYIDDTSLRENSEEMYSLDNDSFLNSLEAMTIQNYWTENVKHTKL